MVIPLAIFLLPTFFGVVFPQECKTMSMSKYGYTLMVQAYKTFIAEDLGDCSLKCIKEDNCSSLNYLLISRRCDFNLWTTKGFPSRLVKREHSVYMKIREQDWGKTELKAVHSCKELKYLSPEARSGIYWIKLTSEGKSSDPPFQVYCDMETDGGGWTLVYSYRFTNFNNFSSSSNALTPTPTWPVSWSSSEWSPKSTTIPLSESSYSAMDFTLWKRIGDEFLVKPNITHWIACKKGTGDLCNWKEGTLACRVVKKVANVCLNIVPTSLMIRNDCGPILRIGLAYYLSFNGRTKDCYPVHDPCGTTSVYNHLKSQPHPGGALYVR